MLNIKFPSSINKFDVRVPNQVNIKNLEKEDPLFQCIHEATVGWQISVDEGETLAEVDYDRVAQIYRIIMEDL